MSDPTKDEANNAEVVSALNDVDDRAVAARLDRAASGIADPNQIEPALELSDDEKTEAIGAVALAFQLYARWNTTLSSGQFYFAPPFGGEITNYMPAVLDLWERCSEHVKAPVCSARLHDICFELKRGDVGRHIRLACQAYLDTAKVDPYVAPDELLIGSGVINRTRQLTRAYRLAKRAKYDDLLELSVESLLNSAEESLRHGRHEPGGLLGLLDPLIDDCVDPRVDQYLDDARSHYANDPHSTAEIIELQVRRAASEETKRALRREQVEGLITFAMMAGGAMKQLNLQQAITLALDFGMTDLVEIATGHLQAMTVEDLGLGTIEHKVSINREAIEGFLATLTSQESWVPALILLQASGPPSGNVDQNRDLVEVWKVNAPFHSSIGKSRVGGDGLLRYTASTQAEINDWMLADQERRQLQLNAWIYSEALHRIGEKWQPNGEAMAQLLGVSAHVDPETADSVARSFIRFFEGDYEAAAYTALPKIEALVRDLVLFFQLPVYRIQRQERPGQYPGLRALMPELVKIGFDESWARYVTTLFCSPEGVNMRNEAMHGFTVDFGAESAALVLTAALYLCLGVVFLREEQAPGPRAEPPDSQSASS